MQNARKLHGGCADRIRPFRGGVRLNKIYLNFAHILLHHLAECMMDQYTETHTSLPGSTPVTSSHY
jgi:hypothetical protein